MDIAMIMELISGVGFPIALVIGLCWFIYKLQNESVARENKLMAIIEEYGKKLAEIAVALEAVSEKVNLIWNKDNGN